MDIPAVRKAATAEFGSDIRVASDKVSDALGFMWRRGLLTRYPAPKDSKSLARFAYAWDAKQDARPVVPVSSPTLLRGKMGINVTEQDGGVLIEFDKFTVLVKPK